MVAGTVTSAAVPGARAWDVVVGDRFIAAVAAPAPDPCLAALATAAADGDVTIESLVGLVPLGGSHPVDSFAFVWWPGPDTSEVTAVVRGDAVVDLTSPGGTRRFDSRGIRPWHLAEFGAVVGIRVTRRRPRSAGSARRPTRCPTPARACGRRRWSGRRWRRRDGRMPRPRMPTPS